MIGSPKCPIHGVEMIAVSGYPGQWQCPLDPGHVFDEDGVAEPAPDRWAPPPHLASEGTFGPISQVPQASQVGDGTGCLPLGELKYGGSSRSGRKRRKKKGGKTFVDSPWEGQR